MKSKELLVALVMSVFFVGGVWGCATSSKQVVKTDTKRAKTLMSSMDESEDEGLEKKEFDLNGDNTPDLLKFYKKEGDRDALVKKEIDLNGDGKIDVWIRYGEDGKKSKEAFDLDFDGRVDLVEFYKDGLITRKEIDFQFDERPDIWKFYSEGKLVRKEMDTNKDGKPDYWEFYGPDGKIKRIGRDLDGDGQIDVEQKTESNEAKPESDIEKQAEQNKNKADAVEEKTDSKNNESDGEPSTE